jgi:hypothetical protein
VRRALLVFLVACSQANPQPATVPLASTVTAGSAEAAYDAKNWSECAAQWTTIAEHTTGDLRAGALYDAACCYALDGRTDVALATLAAALAAGYWDAEHMITDADLDRVRSDARWPALAARVQTQFAAFEKTLVDPQLRVELLGLAAKIDEATTVGEATARLKAAVAKHGWPGKRIVGVDGANAAWVVAQHADDIAFQAECLAKMEPLVKTGEVAGKDYAFLFDRVALVHGRAQRYGTQFDGDDLAPLEDPKNVDARRRSVGLGTLAEYEALVKRAETAKQ